MIDFKPQDRVAYIPYPGCEESQWEHGTVSSKSAKYVFVKFDEQPFKFGWDGTTSQACDPNDLVKL